MTTTEQPTSLADVRAASGARRQAEVTEVVTAVAWIEQHQVDPRTSDDTALRDYGDGELLLGGDGVPAVSETAVVELITTLGRSDSSGRPWLGRALELKYRLPRLSQRVLDGEVDVWRALRMADLTISLPLDGAAFVDSAVADHAHDMSWAQLGRTVEAARALHDPEEFERRRDRDPRRFDVRIEEAGVDGYAPIDGLLDLADARDVEAAVARRADELAATCDEPLDVRRAMALGEICRGELVLGSSDDGGRGVTLYVHVDESHVAETDDGHPVLVDQVATWCAGATVTIKPVIDLNDHHRIDGYVPTETITEQVHLTWPRCVFPYCTRRARRCDKDHRVNHADGGPTCPCNLAPLCRTHHRMKTFAGWSYEPASTTENGIPTAFLWTSPHGTRFRVDRHGCIALPPEP